MISFGAPGIWSVPGAAVSPVTAGPGVEGAGAGADVAIWPGALVAAGAGVVAADEPLLSDAQAAVSTKAASAGTITTRQDVAIRGDSRSGAAKLDGRPPGEKKERRARKGRT